MDLVHVAPSYSTAQRIHTDENPCNHTSNPFISIHNLQSLNSFHARKQRTRCQSRTQKQHIARPCRYQGRYLIPESRPAYAPVPLYISGMIIIPVMVQCVTWSEQNSRRIRSLTGLHETCHFYQLHLQYTIAMTLFCSYLLKTQMFYTLYFTTKIRCFQSVKLAKFSLRKKTVIGLLLVYNCIAILCDCACAFSNNIWCKMHRYWEWETPRLLPVHPFSKERLWTQIWAPCKVSIYMSYSTVLPESIKRLVFKSSVQVVGFAK